MAGYELMGCGVVAMLAPSLRNAYSSGGSSKGNPRDLLEIPGEAGFSGE
jgi:hypothetical protein